MIFHSEIVSHLLISFIYFLFIYFFGFSEAGSLAGLDIIKILAGLLLGTFFLDIDHLLYWFIVYPEKDDSKEAKRIIQTAGQIREFPGRVKELYLLLKKVHCSHRRLVFHSVAGQAILFVLAFYLLTSGGSVFGSAFILSINLHLLKDVWHGYLENKSHLIDWFFWPVKIKITEKLLKIYLAVASFLFLIATKLFISII